jgi:hypothetical protein
MGHVLKSSNYLITSERPEVVVRPFTVFLCPLRLRKSSSFARTGITGSTTTGDYVVMAGRVGVKDHIHTGNGAALDAMAGILVSRVRGGNDTLY